MKAKKKPLETFALDSLGVSPRQRLKPVRYAAAPAAAEGHHGEDTAGTG